MPPCFACWQVHGCYRAARRTCRKTVLPPVNYFRTSNRESSIRLHRPYLLWRPMPIDPGPTPQEAAVSRSRPAWKTVPPPSIFSISIPPRGQSLPSPNRPSIDKYECPARRSREAGQSKVPARRQYRHRGRSVPQPGIKFRAPGKAPGRRAPLYSRRRCESPVRYARWPRKSQSPAEPRFPRATRAPRRLRGSERFFPLKDRCPLRLRPRCEQLSPR